MARYIALDIETTGLDVDRDEITEIAWVDQDMQSRHFIVEHLQSPNTWVAEHTDYLSRIKPYEHKISPITMLEELRVACAFDEPTHIVGANPAFDDHFLRHAFQRYLFASPPYDYHLIDIEAMAFQAFSLKDMPHLKDMRTLLGLPGENTAPHSALADAEEAMLIFQALRSLKNG